MILNPTVPGRRARDLRRALSRHLPRASVIETARADDAARLAREAALSGADPVVAAGGDGVAAGVARGLLEARTEGGPLPALGLLPLGTGNDLARALAIPTDDLDAAAGVVAAGRTRPLDVARLDDGTPLLSALVAGFGGQLRPDARTRRRWGARAYLREAVRSLPALRPHRVVAHLDGARGEERLEESAYTIVICNGFCAGGGIPLVPGARTDDGWLDLLLVRAVSIPALAVLVPRLLAGRHLGTPAVVHRRVRRARLRATPGLWVNVDGERRRARDLEARLAPAALRVLAPPSARPSGRPDAGG